MMGSWHEPHVCKLHNSHGCIVLAHGGSGWWCGVLWRCEFSNESQQQMVLVQPSQDRFQLADHAAVMLMMLYHATYKSSWQAAAACCKPCNAALEAVCQTLKLKSSCWMIMCLRKETCAFPQMTDSMCWPGMAC